MAKDHGPSVKDDKQYEGLRKKGMSKERAAKIANTPNASKRAERTAGRRFEPEQQEQRLGQRRQPRPEAGGGPQGRTEEQLARRSRVADKAMDVYLNDHLAGAMLGSDLAEQLQKENEGTPLGELMATLAPKIEEDRQTLIDLMERMGTSKNPVKQATTWLAEKTSRAKFGGLTSGEPQVGTFMAVEALTLGVEGKASLWRALKTVRPRYPALESVDLDGLLQSAEQQHDALERERIAAAERSLEGENATSLGRSHGTAI